MSLGKLFMSSFANVFRSARAFKCWLHNTQRFIWKPR